MARLKKCQIKKKVRRVQENNRTYRTNDKYVSHYKYLTVLRRNFMSYEAASSKDIRRIDWPDSLFFANG